ncbi:MAG: glycosyltransferase family 39 protein [Bacteroidales bacterium]|nr:glycosyltransferase family 39 protein [Bacteroidales bacterium]
MKNKHIIIQIIIIVVAAIFFIPFIGRVHLFDWDEINFAESAREMIVTGDYLTVRIFFEPFWEKPPLFIWMQVLSMKIFGINEFAARFPNALCGIVTLLVIYNIGRRMYNVRFGIIWAVVYFGSLLPFFYFKSGIIDPWFNIFIFLGVYFWVLAAENTHLKGTNLQVILSAFFLGLAVLTKGPVAVLVFAVLIFILFLVKKFRLGLKWSSVLLFIVTLTFIGGFWFLLQMVTGNFDLVRDFIIYQIRLFNTKDAGHGGFPMYHFVILLIGVFPASVFAIQGHNLKGNIGTERIFHLAMIILLWVVLLLFSLVKTKIVHYSSLTYFPISYLAAYSFYNIMTGEFRYRLWQKILLCIIGAVIALTVILLPVFILFKQVFIDKGLITHSFTIGNLQADPGWNFSHSLIGFTLLIGLIFSFFYFKKNKILQIGVLYISSAVFMFLAILFITPGAERISQNAAIEFIKSTTNQDVYLCSFYKSYATLFYHNQQPVDDKKAFNMKWLTSGDIDKDVYFVLRIDKKNEILNKYPQVIVLYEKNGYVFGLREAIREQ